MDIEKAFDHVPRYLLLKKLVCLGAGKSMLFALKQIYKFSICILKFQGELSTTFRMERGVRRGAASSVLLFNAFMDGLFKHLDSNCNVENLLNDIHTLIHADDTILLSTNRDNFINKCNEAISFFSKNMLSLNLGKSGFIIINPKAGDRKSHLVLNSGILKYKHKLEYLGVYISDSGSLKNDIKMVIAQRRANISIKLTNFCKVNRNAPLSVKLDVLDTCISTSITYACETWGSNVSEAELCYRSGIKVAMNVRENTNNEIIYIESGKYPIECKVKKG